jgi:hypothetical protein
MRIKDESHPLEAVVLRAFAERAHHDGTSLGYFFDNRTAIGGFFPNGKRRKKSSMKECIRQARECLEYMERQGQLYRDERGWFRLTALKEAPAAPAAPRHDNIAAARKEIEMSRTFEFAAGKTTAGELLAGWRKRDPHTARTLRDAYLALCNREVQAKKFPTAC